MALIISTAGNICGGNGCVVDTSITIYYPSDLIRILLPPIQIEIASGLQTRTPSCRGRMTDTRTVDRQPDAKITTLTEGAAHFQTSLMGADQIFGDAEA